MAYASAARALWMFSVLIGGLCWPGLRGIMKGFVCCLRPQSRPQFWRSFSVFWAARSLHLLAHQA